MMHLLLKRSHLTKQHDMSIMDHSELLLLFLLLCCIPPCFPLMSCDICDRTQCPPVPAQCSGGLVLDACECCAMCGRIKGETCSAQQPCDRGLVCDYDSICRELDGSGCTDCCPEDSTWLQGQCECLPCPSPPPDCQSHVIVQGTGLPGHCCHQYACPPKEEDCLGVVCDTVDPENSTCPHDSVPMSPLVTHGGCCINHRGCMCRPCPDGCTQTDDPGNCCTCPGTSNQNHHNNSICEYGGEVHSDGDTWKINPCKTCTCNKGLIVCDTIQCDLHTTSCAWMELPEGQCCHVCKGCMSEHDGSLHPVGSTWQEGDCVTCECSTDGQRYCRAQHCPACRNPTPVIGQCCPLCDDATVITLPPQCPTLDNCSLRCPAGLKQDDQGCFLCECLDYEVSCEHVLCGPGYHLDRISCQCKPCPPLHSCNKSCRHGFKLARNGCPRCKCQKCPPFSCPKNCPHGYVTNSKQCRLCKCRPAPLECVLEDGSRRQEGSSWYDGCGRQCSCLRGRQMCSVLTCPHCPDGCCDTCPAISSSLLPLPGPRCEAGMSWQVDTCTHCVCDGGQPLCEVLMCPPVLCKNPQREEGSCCPICPDSGSPAQLPSPTAECGDYREGDTWRESACDSCLCRNGQRYCFTETCPVLQCQHPVLYKGHCCPSCPVCRHEGHEYPAGESWMSGKCTHCFCHEGLSQCSHICSNSTTASPQPTVSSTHRTNDDDGVQRRPYRDESVTVAILAAMVTLLAMLVLILLALLLRKRRLHEPKISNCTQTYTEVNKRPPKSTNMELKGSNPMVRHSSYSPKTHLDVPATQAPLLNNCDSSSFRKSL